MTDHPSKLLYPGYESHLLINHEPFKEWWKLRPSLSFDSARELWYAEEERKRERCPHCGK